MQFVFCKRGTWLLSQRISITGNQIAFSKEGQQWKPPYSLHDQLLLSCESSYNTCKQIKACETKLLSNIWSNQVVKFSHTAYPYNKHSCYYFSKVGVQISLVMYKSAIYDFPTQVQN